MVVRVMAVKPEVADADCHDQGREGDADQVGHQHEFEHVDDHGQAAAISWTSVSLMTLIVNL